jgi:hypothetical protein
VVTDAELDKLRLDFRGPVFRPGDPGYLEAITSGRHAEVYGGFLWNARFADFRPALIARPGTRPTSPPWSTSPVTAAGRPRSAAAVTTRPGIPLATRTW